jgi:hypothetical protein
VWVPLILTRAAATDGLTWKDIWILGGRVVRRSGAISGMGNIDYRHQRFFPSLRSTAGVSGHSCSQAQEDGAELCVLRVGTYRPQVEASIRCLSRPGVVRWRLRPLVGQLWGINDGSDGSLSILALVAVGDDVLGS